MQMNSDSGNISCSSILKDSTFSLLNSHSHSDSIIYESGNTNCVNANAASSDLNFHSNCNLKLNSSSDVSSKKAMQDSNNNIGSVSQSIMNDKGNCSNNNSNIENNSEGIFVTCGMNNTDDKKDIMHAFPFSPPLNVNTTSVMQYQRNTPMINKNCTSTNNAQTNKISQDEPNSNIYECYKNNLTRESGTKEVVGSELSQNSQKENYFCKNNLPNKKNNKCNPKKKDISKWFRFSNKREKNIAYLTKHKENDNTKKKNILLRQFTRYKNATNLSFLSKQHGKTFNTSSSILCKRNLNEREEKKKAYVKGYRISFSNFSYPNDNIYWGVCKNIEMKEEDIKKNSKIDGEKREKWEVHKHVHNLYGLLNRKYPMKKITNANTFSSFDLNKNDTNRRRKMQRITNGIIPEMIGKGKQNYESLKDKSQNKYCCDMALHSTLLLHDIMNLHLKCSNSRISVPNRNQVFSPIENTMGKWFFCNEGGMTEYAAAYFTDEDGIHEGSCKGRGQQRLFTETDEEEQREEDQEVSYKYLSDDDIPFESYCCNFVSPSEQGEIRELNADVFNVYLQVRNKKKLNRRVLNMVEFFPECSYDSFISSLNSINLKKNACINPEEEIHDDVVLRNERNSSSSLLYERTKNQGVEIEKQVSFMNNESFHLKLLTKKLNTDPIQNYKKVISILVNKFPYLFVDQSSESGRGREAGQPTFYEGGENKRKRKTSLMKINKKEKGSNAYNLRRRRKKVDEEDLSASGFVESTISFHSMSNTNNNEVSMKKEEGVQLNNKITSNSNSMDASIPQIPGEGEMISSNECNNGSVFRDKFYTQHAFSNIIDPLNPLTQNSTMSTMLNSQIFSHEIEGMGGTIGSMGTMGSMSGNMGPYLESINRELSGKDQEGFSLTNIPKVELGTEETIPTNESTEAEGNLPSNEPQFHQDGMKKNVMEATMNYAMENQGNPEMEMSGDISTLALEQYNQADNAIIQVGEREDRKDEDDDEKKIVPKKRGRRGRKPNPKKENDELALPYKHLPKFHRSSLYYKSLTCPKRSQVDSVNYNEIKEYLKGLDVIKSGKNWKMYKLEGLPNELYKSIRPINQRVTGSKTVLLVDELFEKLWEFPYTDNIKVRTVTRGDQFIGDLRIDFHYRQSERTLCRACGRHILKQKFATEHYQRNIYCWKEVMWRLGIPELQYYNCVRNDFFIPRFFGMDVNEQQLVNGAVACHNQMLLQRAVEFVNKELKYYEDMNGSKDVKKGKESTGCELDILELDVHNNILLPSGLNDKDEPYFEITSVYPSSGFCDDPLTKNFCFIKLSFNRIGGMVLRDLFTLECEFLVDWGDNLMTQARKYTLHEVYNNGDMYDVNLRNMYQQRFAYLRCNVPNKTPGKANVKVRIPKTVWHYWEAGAEDSSKAYYEMLDKSNLQREFMCYSYMDNINRSFTDCADRIGIDRNNNNNNMLMNSTHSKSPSICDSNKDMDQRNTNNDTNQYSSDVSNNHTNEINCSSEANERNCNDTRNTLDNNTHTNSFGNNIMMKRNTIAIPSTVNGMNGTTEDEVTRVMLNHSKSEKNNDTNNEGRSFDSISPFIYDQDQEGGNETNNMNQNTLSRLCLYRNNFNNLQMNMNNLPLNNFNINAFSNLVPMQSFGNFTNMNPLHVGNSLNNLGNINARMLCAQGNSFINNMNNGSVTTINGVNNTMNENVYANMNNNNTLNNFNNMDQNLISGISYNARYHPNNEMNNMNVNANMNLTNDTSVNTQRNFTNFIQPRRNY